MSTPALSKRILSFTKKAASTVAILTLVACGTVSPKPEGADLVREKLTNLQANPQLASRAPVEIKAAETAVVAAETPQKDEELARHRVLLADRMVDIAAARAKSRLLVDQREGLSEAGDDARLSARTREADAARLEAMSARRDTASARNDAAQAHSAAERRESELQDQIAELNAQATDRGLVVTLGDVLFSTNKSELKVGSVSNLDKLVPFVIRYVDRTLVIEGHTDSTGEADYNQSLSQRRADSVRNYLVSKGIASSRLTTYGMGESSPVSGNDSATGRQLNRRVEVIISNTLASAI